VLSVVAPLLVASRDSNAIDGCPQNVISMEFAWAWARGINFFSTGRHQSGSGPELLEAPPPKRGEDERSVVDRRSSEPRFVEL
jgi:hypothetical protein